MDDEGFGLVLGQLHVRDVAVEFTGVLSDKLIAFPDLRVLDCEYLSAWRHRRMYLCLGIWLEEYGFDGLHVGW